MPKTTLKEIASILGMSVGTVSKALKDYNDISDSTKQKVRAMVEKMNYIPNSFAQSLRNQESKIIGLIIPQIVHHFFANIIKGVIDAAEKEGYMVILLQTGESYNIEQRKIQLLLDKNVDGILISLSDNTISYDHIKHVINEGIPVVLYDKISKLLHCSKVIIDDQQAAYDATKHLIDTGCKKIAHIRGPLKPQTTIDRFKGYKKALEDHGFTFNAALVYTSERLSYEDGQSLAEVIMNDHPDVDGIFSFTDLVAAGALAGLKKLNIKIPEQVALIGFSNWFLTQITSPSLSTVDQPGLLMGEKSFELLLREIQAKKNNIKLPQEVLKIPTKVISRESTASN